MLQNVGLQTVIVLTFVGASCFRSALRWRLLFETSVTGLELGGRSLRLLLIFEELHLALDSVARVLACRHLTAQLLGSVQDDHLISVLGLLLLGRVPARISYLVFRGWSLR